MTVNVETHSIGFELTTLRLRLLIKATQWIKRVVLIFFGLNQNWEVKPPEALQEVFRLDESQISTPPRA